MDVQAGRLRASTKNIPTSFTCRRTRSFDLHTQTDFLARRQDGAVASSCCPDKTYVRPSGYKVRMEKPGREPRAGGSSAPSAEGTALPQALHGFRRRQIGNFQADHRRHPRPARCSSRISKRISTSVAELIDRDYSDRFADPDADGRRAPFSAAERSLGSVIKLLTPDEHDYTPEYNAWLATVPQYLKELVFVVKRYYKPEWGDDWREHFSVDIINGTPGNELKCDNRKLVTTLSARRLRRRRLLAHVRPAQGFSSRGENPDGGRHHRLRRRAARRAAKFAGRGRQAPRSSSSRTANTACSSGRTTPSIAVTTSRPSRISRSRTISFPTTSRCTPKVARELVEDAIGFHQFTEPMQTLIRDVAANGKPGYFVSSAQSAPRGRQADQKPALSADASRPASTRAKPISRKWARACAAACRRTSPFTRPSTAVLPGRRNNPPEAGHPLARVLQSDSLPRTAGVVHGIHLQHDRQIAFHDRRRFRRRADQRAVQRAAADHRSEQRARVVAF